MSERTLVVTGANGFVGAHVAASAAAAGFRVVAIGRESAPSTSLAPHCDDYIGADLEDSWPAPADIQAVVHLAGLAAVGPSFSEPQRYLTVNSAITTTMCEALLARGARPRVVVVSSGSVYAPPRDGVPIDEQHRLLPSSPYAVAKILVETQTAYYTRRGLDTVIARPFNHIGPGQGSGFIVPDLTHTLQQLDEGSTMRVGNLAASRDFTDVRDVAAAYIALASAQSHSHAVYNVASGVSHSGSEVLAAVAAALGRSIPPLAVDESKLRPGDPDTIVGSAARLRTELGWRPTIGWQQSISDYVTAEATHREER